MQRIEVNTMGFTITKEVPVTQSEYDALAPARTNDALGGSPCVEDAVFNTLYRVVYPGVRNAFVAHLETDTGIKVQNHGTEDAPKWESDGKYIARIVAAKFGGDREAFVAAYTAKVQELMDAQKFDPSVQQRTGEGPAIAKVDRKAAVDILSKGLDFAREVAARLSQKLGREVTIADVDVGPVTGSDDAWSDELKAAVRGLARAYADYRKAQEAELEAQRRSSLGV